MSEPILFPEMMAETESLPEIVPSRQDMYLVMAYRDDYWNIPSSARGPYLIREAAEKAARNLSACWTYRRIVRIPGEGITASPESSNPIPSASLPAGSSADSDPDCG